MDPFSVVTCVASVISLSNAIISTQYDILRAMRSSTERTGGLEKAIEIYKDLLKHLSIYLSDRSDTCARTLSLRSDDVSSCWQLVRSNEPQGWLTRDYISREGEDTKAFEETCASLIHCVQSDGLRTEPALWKLQRWITVSVKCERCQHVRALIPTIAIRGAKFTLRTDTVAQDYQTPIPSILTCFLGGDGIGCCSVLRSPAWR
jgi:hypothetical protein